MPIEDPAARTIAEPEAHLFLLSGPDPAALRRAVEDLHGRLSIAPTASLAELARRFARSRTEAHRLALIATSADDLSQKLEQARELLHSRETERRMLPGIFPGAGERMGRMAFLFPGQGSQFPGMLSELSALFPAVQRWLDELDRAYAKIGRPRPSRVLREGPSPQLYDMPTGAQLGLVASMAMAEFLKAIGIIPDCLVGHSNGERAALLAGGALGSQDPAEACAEFARVSLLAESMQRPLSSEGLLAVICGRRGVVENVLARHPETLFLAISNSPTQMVLGGEFETLDQAAAELKQSMVMCSRLPIERAFHTPLVSDWSELLRRHLNSVRFHPLEVPVYSTLTTKTFPEEADAVRDWMARQWSSTVRFKETIEQIYEDGVRIFVEVGPDAKLSALVQDTLRRQPHLALSASSAGRGERAQLLHLCAALYAAGIPLTLEALDNPRDLRDQPRPLEFQPFAFPWLESRPLESRPLESRPPGSGPAATASTIRAEHQRTLQRIADAERRILDRLRLDRLRLDRLRLEIRPQTDTSAPSSGQIVRSTASEAIFAVHLSHDAAHPYLRDHAMGTDAHGGQRLQVVPFTYTLGLVADAARRAGGGTRRTLTKVQAHRWLALDRGSIDLEIHVSSRHARVFGLQDGLSQLAFEAELSAPASPIATIPMRATTGGTSPVCAPTSFYRDQVFHGPSYHCIRSVSFSGKSVEAEIEATTGAATGWTLDPALLDCAGQLVAYWMLENGWTDFGVFPVAMHSFAVCAAPPCPGTRIRVQGEVTIGAFGITSASFVFALPNAEPLWRVTNFKQKIIAFPTGIRRWLFGKESSPFSFETDTEAGPSDAKWREFLESGQGIWSRVLAHGLLQPAELAALYAEPPTPRLQQMMEKFLEAGPGARRR